MNTMDQSQIAAREAELREQYPHMFGHPEAQEGELLMTSIITEAGGPQVGLYKQAGLTSARLGSQYLTTTEVTVGGQKETMEALFVPIFASIEELILVEALHDEEK